MFLLFLLYFVLFYMLLVSTGLDSSTRDVETNEPEDLLVEDSSQSQANASPFDDSRSVEKMVGFFYW